MHSDPLAFHDGAAMTILSIHYNLALGTIIQYSHDQDSHEGLRHDLFNFNQVYVTFYNPYPLSDIVSGQYMLTEVDHGLDAINLETTATLLPSGEFELHTPHPGAAKYVDPVLCHIYIIQGSNKLYYPIGSCLRQYQFSTRHVQQLYLLDTGLATRTMVFVRLLSH